MYFDKLSKLWPDIWLITDQIRCFLFYFVQVSGVSAKGNSNHDHNFTLSFQKFTHIHIIVDLYLRKIIGTLTMEYYLPLNFDIASDEWNSNISATILKKNHWKVSPNAIFPLHKIHIATNFIGILHWGMRFRITFLIPLFCVLGVLLSIP